MSKYSNQKGFAHIQILLVLVAVVLVSALTLWRINSNSKTNLHSTNLTQEEIAALATESKFIDEDHDLIPMCTDVVKEDCEDEEADHDFDNDGLLDSEDTDDDNDGDSSDESEDDSDNDDKNDDSDSDDDNDKVEDSEDPDDDNDGDEDEDEVEVEDEDESEDDDDNSGRGSDDEEEEDEDS